MIVCTEQGKKIKRRLARDTAMTEEELEYAHFCRSEEERQTRLARDAATNEAEMKDDHLHRAQE